jgi:hypothetical protein
LNIKGAALGFALVLPLTVVGVAHADKPQPPAGALYLNGTTVTAYFVGVKRPDTVRLQAICQTADTSVVWSRAQTLTMSPSTVVYDPPSGLACRVDLFTVSGGNKITYLETAPLGDGAR